MEKQRLNLRPMRPADIPAVVALEREAGLQAWEEQAYRRELAENRAARYLVLECTDAAGTARLVGFGGAWLQLDEAHIVTVAVGAEARRQGYGSLLVLALLDLARALDMTSATLECRVSNTAARALYRGFGFHEVGERKAYYPDNHENAVIMTTEAFDAPTHRERVEAKRAFLGHRFPGAVRGGRPSPPEAL